MMGSGATKSKLTQLIDSLVSRGIIKSSKINQVMRKVDRGDFCSSSIAYEDCPQPIDYNATISAPHMHAYCLVHYQVIYNSQQEWLEDVLIPGNRALDVGCGSGYLCAAFYEMMENEGKVVGIEHIDELCQFAIGNLSKSYLPALQNQSIEVICGDGRLGYAQYAPYNAIHVGAAAPTVPQALLDQLAIGGKLVIPVGPSGDQNIVMIEKNKKGKLIQRSLLGVRYIPLTSKEEQCPHLYRHKPNKK